MHGKIGLIFSWAGTAKVLTSDVGDAMKIISFFLSCVASLYVIYNQHKLKKKNEKERGNSNVK